MSGSGGGGSGSDGTTSVGDPSATVSFGDPSSTVSFSNGAVYGGPSFGFSSVAPSTGVSFGDPSSSGINFGGAAGGGTGGAGGAAGAARGTAATLGLASQIGVPSIRGVLGNTGASGAVVTPNAPSALSPANIAALNNLLTQLSSGGTSNPAIHQALIDALQASGHNAGGPAAGQPGGYGFGSGAASAQSGQFGNTPASMQQAIMSALANPNTIAALLGTQYGNLAPAQDAQRGSVQAALYGSPEGVNSAFGMTGGPSIGAPAAYGNVNGPLGALGMPGVAAAQASPGVANPALSLGGAGGRGGLGGALTTDNRGNVIQQTNSYGRPVY